MPDKPTPFRPTLEKEVEEKLDDFCAAHHEANKTAVVNKAVERFIDEDVSNNVVVRAVYEALRRARGKL